MSGLPVILSGDTENTIREVVKEWVAVGRMFTAFEVSLAAKERGVEERHRNMRNRVHEIIYDEGVNNNYTRMLMDVGAPEQAWLYYPVGGDPYSYQPLDRNAHDTRASGTPAILPPVQAIPLIAGQSQPAVIPQGAYGVDRRGRLCIPVKMLHEIEVQPKDRVNVVSDEDDHVVTIRKRVELTTPLNDDPFEESDETTVYTAENDGNVRVTQRTLGKAGIAGKQCYKIESNGDGEIRITEFA